MIIKYKKCEPGMKYDDFLYNAEQAKNEQLSYMDILAKNLEIARQATPYTIKLPYVKDTKEISNWLNDNKAELITDSAAKGVLYRFNDQEIATMFKLVFGGEFVNDTIQER